MKLQYDKYSIPNENTPGAPEGSGGIQKLLLDSLLTSLYRPFIHTWLNKRLEAGNAGNGSQAEKEAYHKVLLLFNSLLDASQSEEILKEVHLPMDFKEQPVWLRGHYSKLPAPGSQTGSEQDKPASILYLRVWDTNQRHTISMLRHFHQKLKNGDLLVLVVIRFSGFTAYPYHYSFSRTVDLIAELENKKVLQEQWPELLHQNGFCILDSVHSSSAFLPRKHNRIISHCLETFLSDILRQTGTSQEEIDALLPSLKQFEEQKDTLICRPGVHLMLASKV